MKSTLIKVEQEFDYPVLMDDGSNIVLFNNDSSGTVVGTIAGGESFDYSLGTYSDNWSQSQFKVFTNAVRLSNYD